MFSFQARSRCFLPFYQKELMCLMGDGNTDMTDQLFPLSKNLQLFLFLLLLLA